jgi:hypothetical protein
VADCPHMNFEAKNTVARLTDDDDGPVTLFRMDIVVKCSDCQLDFSFPGFDCGWHPVKPTTNVVATELSVRIVPGPQPLAGKATYTIFAEGEKSNKN